VSSISLFLFLFIIPNLAHHNRVCTLAGHELASDVVVSSISLFLFLFIIPNLAHHTSVSHLQAMSWQVM